jgi:hypothetical protein
MAPLISLRDALLENTWPALEAALPQTRLRIKGTATTREGLWRFLHLRQFVVDAIIMEQVLNYEMMSNFCELSGRCVIIGSRGPRCVRDGVVGDITFGLVKNGGYWTLTDLNVQCPPDWALWRNRPNSQASEDYRKG